MSDHTGFTAVRFQTLERALADDVDNAQRLQSKALLDVLRRLFQDEDGSVQSGVLEGLRVSAAASGALAVDIDAGLAFHDDAGSLTDADLDSSYHAIQLRESSEDVSIAASHSTLDRIDAVYVSWTGGTWQSEMRDVRPAAGANFAPTSIDKRIGPEITVSVVTGTADASPVAPSIPAGGVLLAHVTVAAGATTSAGLTVSDQRSFLPTPTAPGTLAGGTSVDGDLNVGDDLTVTDDATVAGDLGVGGNADVVGHVQAAALWTDHAFPSVEHLLCRVGAASGGDAKVIGVVRGGDPASAIKWDESEERFACDPGDGTDYPILIGALDNTGAPKAGKLLVLSHQFTGIGVTGGSPTEGKTLNFNGLPGSSNTGIAVFAQCMNGPGDVMVIQTSTGSSGAGNFQVNVVLADANAANLTAGTTAIWVFAIITVS
jgi:hypothetical protein